MGIVERMAEIQAAEESRLLSEIQEADRIREETEVTRLLAQQLKTQQDTERREAILAEFSPVLEMVKAREQLEVIRDKVWIGGEVDPEPIPTLGIPHESRESLSLGLRFPYDDSETFSSEGGDGGLTVNFRNEVAVEIGVTREDDNTFGISVHSTFSNLTYAGNKNHNYNGRGVFGDYDSVSLENPEEAYSSVEKMLANACIKLNSASSVSKFIDNKTPPILEQPANHPLVNLSWYRRIFVGHLG